MRTYDSIGDYIKNINPKIDDRIALEGHGIMSGLNPKSKHDTFLATNWMEHKDSFHLKEYRGKTRFIIPKHMWNQKVQVLTKKEFKELPILW